VAAEHRFLSFDETPVFYRKYEAAGSAKAVVVILHGMGEHSGRYTHIASYLSEMGFEVYVPDLRGFGQSGGKRAAVRRFADYHNDLKALHSFIDRNRKGLPVFLFGHSFGGLICSSYAAFASGPRIKGLVLSSPIFGIAVPVPFWRKVLGLAASYVVPDFTQPNGVDPQKLTHDQDILAVYKKDTLLYRRISARLFRELIFMTGRRSAIASRVSCPTLIVQSGDDRVVSQAATQQFYDDLKAEDRRIVIYPDFYHEVLNETGREKVFSTVGQWLLERV
jgi:alpha-beta hydrolase superfamily lysophospholipase